MSKMKHPERDFLGVKVGARLKFTAKDGAIKLGKVVEIDESTFPTKLLMLDDDQETHEVLIGVGWPD